MNRRVAFITLSLAILCFFGALGILFRTSTNQLGADVRINWPSQLSPCSATVKVNCTLSLNIVAFRQDGSMFTVARALPPNATGVDAVMPEGLYEIWVMATGRNENADFTLSVAATKAVEITRDKSTESDDPDPSPEEFDPKMDKI